MKYLVRGLLLGAFLSVCYCGYAQAKVCFLPIGGCNDETFKVPNEYGDYCPAGYRMNFTECSGNFTLETETTEDGVCGKCSCLLSCPSHQTLNHETCTCSELNCPLGTSSSCVDDACYECSYQETLTNGTACYKNTRKEAHCPSNYSLSKPNARCLLELQQICGSETCYKTKTCEMGFHLNENCECIENEDDDACPAGYQIEKMAKCSEEIDYEGHKCYKTPTCSNGYTLNEATCECECDNDLIDVDGKETCVDCDEDGVNPCTEKGYKLCRTEDFLIGEGSVVCTCGDKEYYERCSTLEACYVDEEAVFNTIDGCHQEVSTNSTAKYHDGKNNVYVNNGRYFVKKKCQKVDLSWVIHTAECDVEKDCNGHAGPAYGKISTSQCVGGVGSNTEKCGGAEYVTKCQCPLQKNATIKTNGGTCSYLDAKTLPLDGYYKVDGYDCSAGGETFVAVASCLAKTDCLGNTGLAYGKMKKSQCIGGRGYEEITCGNENYVSRCQCQYRKGDAINANGGICYYRENSAALLSSGYYKVDGYDCTAGNETGTAVASCTVKKDCNGQPGPAAGLINCKAKGLYPADNNPVVCGGNVYSALCKDACNYDDTEATCRAQGKSFVSYCVAHTDKGDVAHGVCVD